LQARETSLPAGADSIRALHDPDSCFPIEPGPEHYESSLEEGRSWVSFRDPYFGVIDDQGWLLAAARTKEGPIVRRGCVGLMKEVAPNQFESRPSLHHPGLYDDVEVPGVFELEGQYYLIGSIREDAKIRYWHSDCVDGPWRSYHDNVLMPQGNYAGRICRDDKGWLLWCFFAMNRQDRTADNLMPPPKRLKRDADGLLYLSTFEQFETWCAGGVDTRCVQALREGGPSDHCHTDQRHWEISSPDGFQAFVFEEQLESFWLEGTLKLHGKGKCGLVFRIHPETHDGYYLSLDLLKGVAQLRAWGTAEDQTGEHMMLFSTLQSGFWYTKGNGEAKISLLTFGSYIELSINGRIVLSLADRRFQEGSVGVYLETATLEVQDLNVRKLRNPDQLENHLVGG
jgi:beta-fructofuranosidase